MNYAFNVFFVVLFYNRVVRIAVQLLYSHDVCLCIQCFVFLMLESVPDATPGSQDRHKHFESLAVR